MEQKKPVSMKEKQVAISNEISKYWQNPITGMEFVWVPKGCFMMGSPADEKGREPDEGPTHKVCVDGLWMSKYEVTNAQFHLYKSIHNSQMYMNGDKQPAVHISWNDANAFAQWLTRQSDSEFVFRLPFEAEWEYAARAGSSAAAFYGDDPNDVCRYANVYDEASKQMTGIDQPYYICTDNQGVSAPVGSYQPNAFGLHDMLGNAFEWCQDWRRTYAPGAVSNPKGPSKGSYRAYRGGGWLSPPETVRSANREFGLPDYKTSYTGIRLIRIHKSKYEIPEAEVPQVNSATRRELTTGTVLGSVDKNNSHAWLGIPYSRPPVGDLRWKAPMSTKQWSEPLKALNAGQMCTQYSTVSEDGSYTQKGRIIGQEDCLYLNVWAPFLMPDSLPKGNDRLPVMVWIHGGGNSTGNGGDVNGAILATTHRLIVVSFNYRLGPFGWFSHPALSDTDINQDNHSGNYGTLDMIQALRWVKNNISQFGGDPANVTIFGESAGSADVLSMMASPKAKGLFHRAVAQSGNLWITPLAVAQNFKDDEDAGHPFSSREVLSLLLIQDGIARNRDEAKSHQNQMSNEEIASYLRNKSSEEILSIYSLSLFGMINSPKLIGDGIVLPGETSDKLFSDSSRFNSVPILIGSTRDEEKLFMSADPRYINTLTSPLIKNPVAYTRDARYLSDMAKIQIADNLAKRLTESQKASVFVYRFDWDEEKSFPGTDVSVLLGAGHGLEIPFVFNDFDLSNTFPVYMYRHDKITGRNTLAKSMSSYWAEFAYSGNPGRGRDGAEVLWTAWDNTSKESSKYIVLDTIEDKGIHMTSDVLTIGDLKNRLLSDTSFAAQKDYCRMYWMLFRYNSWDQAEYEGLGEEGCKAYDPDKFD